MVRRSLAVVVVMVSALAVACGRADDAPRGGSTAAPAPQAPAGVPASNTTPGTATAETAPTAPPATAPEAVAGAEELTSRLIGLDDLPGGGWSTPTAEDDGDDDGSGVCGFEYTTDDNLPKAEAEYIKGTFGPFVNVAIVRYPSKAARVAAIENAERSIEDCIAKSPVPKLDAPGETTTYSRMKAPSLAGVDDVHALRMSAEGMFPAQGDVLFFEGRDTTLVLVAHIGFIGLDFDQTQRIAQAQANKAA